MYLLVKSGQIQGELCRRDRVRHSSVPAIQLPPWPCWLWAAREGISVCPSPLLQEGVGAGVGLGQRHYYEGIPFPGPQCMVGCFNTNGWWEDLWRLGEKLWEVLPATGTQAGLQSIVQTPGKS